MDNTLSALVRYLELVPLTSSVRDTLVKPPPAPVYRHCLFPATNETAIRKLATLSRVPFAMPHAGYVSFLEYTNGAILFYGSLLLYGKSTTFPDEPLLAPRTYGVCLSMENQVRVKDASYLTETMIGTYRASPQLDIFINCVSGTVSLREPHSIAVNKQWPSFYEFLIEEVQRMSLYYSKVDFMPGQVLAPPP